MTQAQKLVLAVVAAATVGGGAVVASRAKPPAKKPAVAKKVDAGPQYIDWRQDGVPLP